MPRLSWRAGAAYTVEHQSVLASIGKILDPIRHAVIMLTGVTADAI